MNKITSFLKEVSLEVRKVNWPTRQKTLQNTLLVIAMSAVVAAILSVFDIVFLQLLERFLL
jgi:preprotein translocase subunit SecE